MLVVPALVRTSAVLVKLELNVVLCHALIVSRTECVPPLRTRRGQWERLIHRTTALVPESEHNIELAL